MPTLIGIKNDIDTNAGYLKADEASNGFLSDALESAKLNLELASAMIQREIDNVNSVPPSNVSQYEIELQ